MTLLQKVEFIHGLNAPREAFASNIARNLARGLPTLRTKGALLVAGGPSAADYVDDIRDHQKRGFDLFAVNGAHDWLIGNGIIPDACVLMEASEVVGTFVKRPQADCRYYLASQCHPTMFDRLSGYDVCMWHAYLDEAAIALVEGADPHPTILAGGNTVGLHTVAILHTLGVRRLRAYGMDSSHRGGADHAYDNSQQSEAKEIEFFFEGKRYLSTGTWAAQAEMFARFLPRYFRLGLKIEVIGDGLLPEMARATQQKFILELTNAPSQTGKSDG